MHHDNPPGQTNLATVRMPGKEKTEAPRICLCVHFRRMAKKHLASVFRNTLQGAVKIMSLVEIGIVDADEVQALAVALDWDVFIQQSADTGSFQRRQLVEEIVIAQDRIGRSLQPRENLQTGIRCPGSIAKSRCTKISGNNGEIILQPIQRAKNCGGKVRVQVGMQIRELENPISVEGSRQAL